MLFAVLQPAIAAQVQRARCMGGCAGKLAAQPAKAGAGSSGTAAVHAVCSAGRPFT
jgi:hypothetical protein